MSYDIKFSTRRIGMIIAMIAIVATIAFTLSASIKIVDAGHRGVLLHFQEVDTVEPPLGEGLHFVTPLQDDVVNIEVRTQKYEKQTNAGTKDLQVATTTIALNFHPSPEAINDLYKEVGLDYANRIIQPAVEETVKQVTANYNAAELITKRPQLKADIEESLRVRLAQYDIIQDGVSITDFSFTSDFQDAINKKVKAEQDALAAENQVKVKEAEARQAEAVALGLKLAAIQNAEGIKQAAILEAEGHAQAIILQANADKEKIRLITEFLQNNPEYIEWFRILQWNGHLPETLLNGGDVSALLQIPSKVIKEE